MKITQEYVRELFKYNGKDLVWNVRRYGATKGRVAGNVGPRGYRRVGINGKIYFAHRLVWLYNYGYFPEYGIDHINRNKSDNRIENLREVSQQCNLRNSCNRTDNSSGVKGVSFCKSDKIWRVRIAISSKEYTLGRSKEFSEAVLLRYAAEQCLGWGRCDKMTPARKYALRNNLAYK